MPTKYHRRYLDKALVFPKATSQKAIMTFAMYYPLKCPISNDDEKKLDNLYTDQTTLKCRGVQSEVCIKCPIYEANNGVSMR